MNDLETRLNILKQAGQIKEDSVLLANKIIEFFKDDVGIELSESNGAMLITHIVMANERIKKNEPVEKLNEMIVSQIKQDKMYLKAQEITSKVIKFFGETFVSSEEDYINMHVLNLVKENL